MYIQMLEIKLCFKVNTKNSPLKSTGNGGLNK